MLATPYLAHYVLINREANTGGSSRAMPVVNNLLEFLTLGWEGISNVKYKCNLFYS